MAKIEYNIFKINPDSLSGFRALSNEDVQLLVSAEISKTFKPNDNFIELSYFTLSGVRLETITNYTNYSILSGDRINNESGNSEIGIDVEQDFLSYGYQGQEVKALYNFLDYPYSNTTSPQDFYIESISPDRTEVRLVSVNLGASQVLETTNQLISQFESQAFSPDLHLYFGNNIFFSIVNIDVEEFRETNAVLVKLYSPLPSTVVNKTRLNIVEKISDSIAFEINTKVIPDIPTIPTLRSANFNVEVETQVTEPTQYYNYNELFSFPTNNTYRELNSLFNEKGAQLSIDYSDFSNFVNFSSAEERLRNFEYKLQLIESYQGSLDSIDNNIPTYSGVGISGSREYFQKLLNGILDNFDHYERHLFYESGSTSWPKGNTTRPYVNVGTSTGAGITWFNAEVQDAILYDAQNPDILTNTVPAYLKEDPDNRPYELFVHMVGQHFDNLWLYTDAVSKKYDSDNRLNKGVSKDLVEDLLKNFGVKLYTSNRSADDLFRYFTANSYQIDDLEPNLDPIITGSNNPVSQNDYQKEIYKRIYHNLPLLMKSKGTERGLRALINCFGIPSDTLKIRLYGGQSSEDLPFFGGRQAFTGSLDKVRLNNTGSIVDGDTVSQYTSIFKLDNYFTQDLHNIEVGFSPTHNVDEYIISQSAVLFPDTPFDIDDYIGDPREIASNTYYALRDYADTIFNGVNSYDLKDFVRFIKFFDNVIFRMVRDFIPARTVADTGIIIKPHLLERSKYEAPVMSWTRPEYSGSINTAFITGSDGGAYRSFATGSVSGSLLTRYAEKVQTPSGVRYVSWTDARGNIEYSRYHEEARFDGQLSGSRITVSSGELNDENPYKKLDYKEIIYDIRFSKEVPANACLIQSLGSTTNPYVIRPTENPYDLSSLFSNAPLAAFDFTVDGSSGFRDPGAYEFDFSFGNQYSSTTITAVSSSTTSVDCTATTVAVKVTCDATLNPFSIPDTNVFTDQDYDLTSWFIQNSNSANTIFVNGTALTTGEALSYRFSGNEGDLVDVKFQDNADNTCKIERTFTIKECSLEFVQPSGMYENIGSNQWIYKVREHFSNTRPYSIYKVIINYLTNEGSSASTVALDIPIPFNMAPTDSRLPAVPMVKSDVRNIYNRADYGVGGVPDEIQSQNYISVEFSARNTLQCAAGTTAFPLYDSSTVINPPVFRSATFSYDSTTSGNACNPTFTNTVYTRGRIQYTAQRILDELVPIFTDEELTEFAPAGYYATINPSASPGDPNYPNYRYWDGDNWTGIVVTDPPTNRNYCP